MGIPKAVASDDGGELGRFKEILDGEGVDHILMTTHLWFIGRFTRTIKYMLHERVEHTGNGWHRLLANVINQYKHKIHSSTRFNMLML